MGAIRRDRRFQRALPRVTSIRWRLTLWYVAILGLILLTFGGLVYASQAHSIRAQQEAELRKRIQMLATAYQPTDVLNGQLRLRDPSEEPEPPSDQPPPDQAGKLATVEAVKREALQSGDPAIAEAVRQKALQSGKLSGALAEVDLAMTAKAPPLGDEEIVIVVNIEGRVLQQFGPVGDAEVKQILAQVDPFAPRADDASLAFAVAPTASKAAVEATGREYLFSVTRILAKNQTFGTLILGRPDQTSEQLQRLILTLALAAPATLLVAAVGGYWLAARAMRPVRLITRTAQEIGATDLSRRLNLATGDELGELAATFDQMLDRLEAAFRRQRQFTSDASHELRTPLTIVQLEVERALAGRRSPEEHERALATIRAENAYMSRLVNDLLVLARADSGRAELERELVDLSDVALEVVERLGPLARRQGLDLAVGDLPELLVDGDRLYLTQMLVNIVENAVKYTAGGGGRVWVETGSGEAGGAARAWARVTDTGPGVAAEHLPRLFERFYRVDQARARADGDDGRRGDKPGGSGLGLAIVQWIAEVHGGEVRVRSEVGRGSTFEVWLPLARAAADDPAPAAEPRATSAGAVADAVGAAGG